MMVVQEAVRLLLQPLHLGLVARRDQVHAEAEPVADLELPVKDGDKSDQSRHGGGQISGGQGSVAVTTAARRQTHQQRHRQRRRRRQRALEPAVELSEVTEVHQRDQHRQEVVLCPLAVAGPRGARPAGEHHRRGQRGQRAADRVERVPAGQPAVGARERLALVPGDAGRQPPPHDALHERQPGGEQRGDGEPAGGRPQCRRHGHGQHGEHNGRHHGVHQRVCTWAARARWPPRGGGARAAAGTGARTRRSCRRASAG